MLLALPSIAIYDLAFDPNGGLRAPKDDHHVRGVSASRAELWRVEMHEVPL